MNSKSHLPFMNRIHRQNEAEASLARAISKTVSHTPDRSRTAARFWTAATESAESPLSMGVELRKVVNSRRPGATEGKAVTPLGSSPQSRTLARSSWRLSLILLATFALSISLQAEPRYREGHLLVKWKDGPESYAAAVGNASIGSTVNRNFNAIGWQHVELPPGMAIGNFYPGEASSSLFAPFPRVQFNGRFMDEESSAHPPCPLTINETITTNKEPK
jgi:hypothetical protein